MEREASDAGLADIGQLKTLDTALERIPPESFSKYQLLLKTIQEMGWTPRDASDRLVIFTERVETLKYLHHHLARLVH